LAQAVNIVYLLLCHLNRHKWFELPGIGVFTAQLKDSYIDHIEKKIYPSSLAVRYSQDPASRTEQMIRNIMEETGYEQETLEEHLAAICKFLSEGLKVKGRIEFKPFGVLWDSGNDIRFEQSPENIHQDFYMMDALPLEPAIVHTVKRDVPIQSQPVTPLRKTKSKKNWLILISALVLLWILFLSVLFCPSKSDTPEHEEIKKADDSLLLDQGNDLETDSSTIHFGSDSTEHSQDSSHLFNNEVVIDSSNIEDLNRQIKYKPCVIIVGSFKYIPYADRMADKVHHEGYLVFREKFGVFNRVGVEFNCFEKDLQQMIEELKQKFHPDAWVLKY
jgi:hypothetical protein